MSKPKHARFELHAIDERVKILLLALGVAVVIVVGFGMLVVWANSR